MVRLVIYFDQQLVKAGGAGPGEEEGSDRGGGWVGHALVCLANTTSLVELPASPDSLARTAWTDGEFRLPHKGLAEAYHVILGHIGCGIIES